MPYFPILIGSQFCQSDTNINYETLDSMHPIPTTPPSMSTLTASATSAPEHLSKHRRIIHKPGSRSIGARFATVDYVDTKTLSIQSLNKNLSNHSLAYGQGDSAVSLTSSCDSVNLALNQELAARVSDHTNAPAYVNQLDSGDGIVVTALPAIINDERQKASTASPCHSSSSGDDSYYEKTVETYLENDGIFRDSAFYSDDNNDRTYIRQEHIYSTIDEVKCEIRKKPAPPPKLSQLRIQSIVARAAPPIPRMPKPASSRIHQNGMASPPKMSPPKIPNAESIESSGSEKRASNEYRSLSSDTSERNTLDVDMTDSDHAIAFENSIEFSLPPPTSPPPPPPIPPRSNLNKKSTWIQKKCEMFEK